MLKEFKFDFIAIWIVLHIKHFRTSLKSEYLKYQYTYQCIGQDENVLLACAFLFSILY